MIKIEKFRKKSLEVSDSEWVKKFVNEKLGQEQRGEIQELRVLKKQYLDAGFEAQASLVDQKIGEIVQVPRKEIAEMLYVPISKEQMKIWKVWLPTRYTEKRFSEYSFDQIPQEALEELTWCKRLSLFDTFEIRTPEKEKAQDPVLIAWLVDIPYLIARWGESLMPFKKIEEIVKKSEMIRKRENYVLRLVLCLTVILALLFFWFLPQIFGVEKSGIVFEIFFTLLAGGFFGLMLSGIIVCPVADNLLSHFAPLKFDSEAFLDSQHRIAKADS